MSYPEALRSYLTGLPFLGTATVSASQVEAGSWQSLEFVYTVGAAGVADGAGIKLVYKFYSDWANPQFSDPKGPNFCSVEFVAREPFAGESPSTVKRLVARFDQKGHERPYQKAIRVDVVDGYLKPGDKIILRLGDRRNDGPGSRVQTFAESNFRFRLFVDPVGASRFAEVPSDLQVAIVAGRGSVTRILAPRVVRPDQQFRIVFRREDQWGNLAQEEAPSGHLVIQDVITGKVVQTIATQWNGDGRAWATTTLLERTETQRELRWEGATALVTSDAAFPSPQSWYADLHVHSDDTVGVNPTAEVLGYARGPASLDIVGYTANDFNIRADRWAVAEKTCRTFHKEKRFLCFPGTEWCGASSVGGDRNVIFLGNEVRFPLANDGRSMRVFEWNEDTRRSEPLVSSLTTAADLHSAYADLAADDQVLLIPHVGGRRALFEWHHPELERLIEVASSWGHFDWFYRDALARGLEVGVSAAGDEHRGRPGGGAPGVGSFGVHGGLTGVLTDELSSTAVAKALRSRRTWATTGTRAVALLKSGSALQGDKIKVTGNFVQVRYAAFAEVGWELLQLLDQKGAVLHERRFDAELGYSKKRIRVSWGGARIRDRYRWAEWEGSLTFKHTKVNSWQTHGLEHPEECVSAVGGNRFDLRSDTYGDTDSIELELSSLERAELTLDLSLRGYNKLGADAAEASPPVRLQTTVLLSKLLEDRSSATWPLGGEGLFVSIHRLSDEKLPDFAQGNIRIPLNPTSRAPVAVYLFGRERSDSKVWTSPLFIQPA